MVRIVAISMTILLGAGCGRVGFSDRSEPPDVDAAASDAAIDATPDAPPMLLETMTLPTDGTTVNSLMTLTSGTVYTLVASGTYTAVPPAADPLADAEYWDLTDTAGGGPKDGDTTHDLGIGIDDPTDDLMKTPNWGPYRSDHVYTVPFTGKGAPIAVRVQDCCYGDNTGTLTLEIFF